MQNALFLLIYIFCLIDLVRLGENEAIGSNTSFIFNTSDSTFQTGVRSQVKRGMEGQGFVTSLVDLIEVYSHVFQLWIYARTILELYNHNQKAVKMPVKKMADMDENKSDFTIEKPSLESDHLIFTVLADIVKEDNLTMKNTSLSHKNNELTPDRIQQSEPLVNLTSLEYGEELLQEPAKQVDQTKEESENDLQAHLRPNKDVTHNEQTTPLDTNNNSETSFILSTFKDVAATSTTIEDEAEDVAGTSITIKDKAATSTIIKNVTSTATTMKDVAATATTIESVASAATNNEGLASTATTIGDVAATVTTIEDVAATETTIEDVAATETTVENVAATSTTLKDASATTNSNKGVAATASSIKDVAATATDFEDVATTRTILENVASDKIQDFSTSLIFENIESFASPDASATISKSPTSNLKNAAITFKAVTFQSKIAGFTTEASTQNSNEIPHDESSIAEIVPLTTEKVPIERALLTTEASTIVKVPSTIKKLPPVIEIGSFTTEAVPSVLQKVLSTIEIEPSTTKNILFNREKATSNEDTPLEAGRQIFTTLTSKTPMNVEISTTESEIVAVNNEASTAKIETFTSLFGITSGKSERIKSFSRNLDSNSKNKIPTNRKGLFDAKTEISAYENARPVTATTVSSLKKEEPKDEVQNFEKIPHIFQNLAILAKINTTASTTLENNNAPSIQNNSLKTEDRVSIKENGSSSSKLVESLTGNKSTLFSAETAAPTNNLESSFWHFPNMFLKFLPNSTVQPSFDYSIITNKNSVNNIPKSLNNDQTSDNGETTLKTSEHKNKLTTFPMSYDYVTLSTISRVEGIKHQITSSEANEQTITKAISIYLSLID